MTNIKFTKMSGAGNDFVIVDSRTSNYQFSKQKISKISNRDNIGCDQFILIKNSTQADVFMEIYNLDGSKSGACGNATRCVADIIMREKSCQQITIETAADILECRRVSLGSENLIAVNMGKPKFEWSEIPLAIAMNTEDLVINEVCNYHFSAANVGNPHLVTFLTKPISDSEFFNLGPKLETNQLFPEKINVEFARIIAPNHIEVRVWERGSGETLACGSGACAVAVLAIKKGLVAREKITTSFKGGDLFIEWREDNSIIMTGDFQTLATGTFDL